MNFIFPEHFGQINGSTSYILSRESFYHGGIFFSGVQEALTDDCRPQVGPEVRSGLGSIIKSPSKKRGMK